MSENIFENLNISIKDYIKNLLIFCGNDTAQHLADFNQESLSEMELYIRQKIGKNSAYNSPEMLNKFFGETIVSFNEVQDFSSNPGAKKSLLVHLPKAAKAFISR
jgi:hypothetical protein